MKRSEADCSLVQTKRERQQTGPLKPAKKLPFPSYSVSLRSPECQFASFIQTLCKPSSTHYTSDDDSRGRKFDAFQATQFLFPEMRRFLLLVLPSHLRLERSVSLTIRFASRSRERLFSDLHESGKHKQASVNDRDAVQPTLFRMKRRISRG
jgi:hypothetical protein